MRRANALDGVAAWMALFVLSGGLVARSMLVGRGTYKLLGYSPVSRSSHHSSGSRTSEVLKTIEYISFSEVFRQSPHCKDRWVTSVLALIMIILMFQTEYSEYTV